MGVAVCKQENQSTGEEVIQDYVQPYPMASANCQASKLDGSNLTHPSLKKKTIAQVTGKLPDDPISMMNSIVYFLDLSENQSSLLLEEKQEPTTPALPTQQIIHNNQRYYLIEWRYAELPEHLIVYEGSILIGKAEFIIKISFFST
ncbi:unnamed protein product (macronuclear) [Paramecium tetraurelia]|uniref:Uncharacterized protein n=1 Tax=Paramecium tetraurelia TaxID=5888 RepID=A0DSR6_PARTE|nr:uncharacterized protein GSPATT00019776001 [Paramecium tetraurelia]CAK86083.1 unnamed protein product [Paramecium tetraurelia]|eukprot:XP_001453480.1 hypothetical protein (macronuclear) [Paramecium tetraurelia strain d4-2]